MIFSKCSVGWYYSWNYCVFLCLSQKTSCTIHFKQIITNCIHFLLSIVVAVLYSPPNYSSKTSTYVSEAEVGSFFQLFRMYLLRMYHLIFLFLQQFVQLYFSLNRLICVCNLLAHFICVIFFVKTELEYKSKILLFVVQEDLSFYTFIPLKLYLLFYCSIQEPIHNL